MNLSAHLFTSAQLPPDDVIRLLEEEQQLSGASADHLMLKDQVKQVRQEVRRLKKKYDSLLEESRLREERVRGQSLKHPGTLKDNRHR